MSIDTILRYIKNTIFIILLSSSAHVLALVTSPSVTCDNPTYSRSMPINMGSFNPYNYANIIIPVTMSITCRANCDDDANVKYIVTLGDGGSGNILVRDMTIGPNKVLYNIYTSPNTSSSVYGDGTSGTFRISANYSLSHDNQSQTNSWILYFVVPVQPLSVPGNYIDTINVNMIMQ